MKITGLLSLALCLSASNLAFGSNADTIVIGKTAPYSDSNKIQTAILNECRLPEIQADYLEKAMAAEGITVVKTDDPAKTEQGKVLLVEITDALSTGNAFIGHHKRVSIKGRLLDNGKEIGSFTGLRSSGGGAFAGFKGSCSVLDRCTQALAKDINRWLKKPSMDARIGE